MDSRHKKRILINNNSGQTVVETVSMLLILLLIFFLIAEFARAWYLKNSLNNAVRVGVRSACVTPGFTSVPDTLCTNSSNALVNSICSAPGVPDSTVVSITLAQDVAPAGASTGDIIRADATAPFTALVSLVEAFMPDYAFSSASMRYE